MRKRSAVALTAAVSILLASCGNGSIVKSFRTWDQAEADETKLQNFTITYVSGAGARKSTDIISGLSSLERAGMAMLKGMTETAAVTRDNLTDGAREWLFAQIPEIVTGQAEIPEVVEQVLQKNAG